MKKVTIYSRNATIEEFAFADCHSNLTIYGFNNSTAQEYAEMFSSFKTLDKPAATGLVLKDTSAKCEVKVVSSSESNPTVAYVKSTNKSAKSITIPDTVEIKGITYKVTSVSANAFANNKKVQKVTVGKNVTSIGKNAFKDCKNLRTATLKSTKLKNISANAFYGCKNLTTITIKSTKLTKKSIGKNVLKGTNKKLVIKVPKNMVNKYKSYFKNKGNKTVKVKK